jgi:hypothetical protein
MFWNQVQLPTASVWWLRAALMLEEWLNGAMETCWNFCNYGTVPYNPLVLEAGHLLNSVDT